MNADRPLGIAGQQMGVMPLYMRLEHLQTKGIGNYTVTNHKNFYDGRSVTKILTNRRLVR